MLVEVFNNTLGPALYFPAHIDLLVAQLISGRYAENGLIVEEDDSLVPCVSDENFMFGLFSILWAIFVASFFAESRVIYPCVPEPVQ